MADGDPTSLDAQALIELYFEVDSDEERDVLLDRLEALDHPLVTEFWRAAAAEDDDELVQTRALCVLARRGEAEAVTALRAIVDAPDDLLVFEEALRTIADIDRDFATVEAIWRNDSRGADERRIAMVVMETLDPPRTIALFHAFIAGLGDAQKFPDDQVEVILLAFVRHEARDVIPALTALHQRLAASSQGMDEDERDELLGMVQEGIDLLG